MRSEACGQQSGYRLVQQPPLLLGHPKISPQNSQQTSGKIALENQYHIDDHSNECFNYDVDLAPLVTFVL